MIYTFDATVAKEYGVNEAIMIANFQFWISKNKANGKNFVDGHYWTYNSKRAFLELFPFWTEQNIKTILKHLKDQGVIITGNYNKNNYDHTLWYAFADDNTWLNNIKQNNTSLSENQPIDRLELTNRAAETNRPIPDIIPDINTNIKTDILSCVHAQEPKPNSSVFDTKTMELWNSIAEKYKLAKVSIITPKRHTALLARMKDIGVMDLDEFFEKIRKAVKESTFLRGKEYVQTANGYESRNKEWRCDFDFFLQQKSLVRAIEGGYADPDLVTR